VPEATRTPLRAVASRCDTQWSNGQSALSTLNAPEAGLHWAKARTKGADTETRAESINRVKTNASSKCELPRYMSSNAEMLWRTKMSRLEFEVESGEVRVGRQSGVAMWKDVNTVQSSNGSGAARCSQGARRCRKMQNGCRSGPRWLYCARDGQTAGRSPRGSPRGAVRGLRGPALPRGPQPFVTPRHIHFLLPRHIRHPAASHSPVLLNDVHKRWKRTQVSIYSLRHSKCISSRGSSKVNANPSWQFLRNLKSGPFWNASNVK